jgi:hypothetical protein
MDAAVPSDEKGGGGRLETMGATVALSDAAPGAHWGFSPVGLEPDGLRLV